MKNLILILTCILTFSTYSQIGFKTRLLKIQESMAYNSNPKTITKQMKNEGYESPKKEKTDGSYRLSFDGGDYKPHFFFYYHTDNQLITSYGFDSPQQYYKCVSELRENGFTVLSSEKVMNENNVEVTIETWGKQGYPYQYLTNPNKYFIQLATSISEIYVD